MYFALALVPSILFGFTGILLMKTGGSPRQQTVGHLSGAFVVAVILAFVIGVDTQPSQVALALLAGVMMALGILLQMRAFHSIGVSRQMPITTGLQLALTSLFGIFLFGEWVGSAALPVGILGMVLLTAGVLMASWTQKTGEGEGAVEGPSPLPFLPPEPTTGEVPQVSAVVEAKGEKEVVHWKRGIIETLISTLFFVLSLITIRFFQIDPMRSFLPQSVGMMAVAFIGTSSLFYKNIAGSDRLSARPTWLSLVPGVMWAAALIIVQFSQVKVGVALGFGLSQLSVIISTFGGIAWLGETRTKLEMKVISLGVVSLVAGTMLLALAKSLDGA